MKTIAMVVVMVASLAMADEKPKAAPKPIAAKDIIAMVPKELHGSTNAAAGKPFSVEKWNEWLEQNIVGKTIEYASVEFTGNVVAYGSGYAINVAVSVPERPPGAPGSGNSGKHLVIATCRFDAKHKETLAKLTGGETIRVSGVASAIARKARDIEGPQFSFTEVNHAMMLDDCTIAITAKAKKARP